MRASSRSITPDLVVEEVDLAQAAVDGLALVGRQLERRQPLAPALAEHIADGRAAFEVAGQHGVQLVLCPRPLAHQLRAAGSRRRSERVPSSGLKTAGRKPGVEQLAERPGVDLVGLHLGLGDRAHLARVGDHHPGDVGLEDRA